MFGLTKKTSYLAAILLIIALFHGAAHAAVHGVGEHEHDGVTCVYGASNEDDSDLSALQGFTLGTSLKTDVDTTGYLHHEPFSSDLRVPPATGPPLSS